MQGNPKALAALGVEFTRLSAISTGLRHAAVEGQSATFPEELLAKDSNNHVAQILGAITGELPFKLWCDQSGAHENHIRGLLFYGDVDKWAAFNDLSLEVMELVMPEVLRAMPAGGNPQYGSILLTTAYGMSSGDVFDQFNDVHSPCEKLVLLKLGGVVEHTPAVTNGDPPARERMVLAAEIGSESWATAWRDDWWALFRPSSPGLGSQMNLHIESGHDWRLAAKGCCLTRSVQDVFRVALRFCEALVQRYDVAGNSAAGEASLSPKEQIIWEAVGNDSLSGVALAHKAGYPCNSAFRNSLSQLVKRGVLKKGENGRCYRRA